ncbi:MAG: ABC transporter permease subunit/CPBP intramembrane protease [Pirellulales bacterium]
MTPSVIDPARPTMWRLNPLPLPPPETTTMSWANVRLIFQREVRDQLRDRRTLFTITVLPLVLYPLMGMSFLQITQFMQEHPTRVAVSGSESLPTGPALIEDGKFATAWCSQAEARLLSVELTPEPVVTGAETAAEVQRAIQEGRYDALLVFPPDFAEKLAQFRAAVRQARPGADVPATPDSAAATTGSESSVTKNEPLVPEPRIYLSVANDKSRMAGQRVEAVLRRWREAIVKETLRDHQLPAEVVTPFELKGEDVAEAGLRRAAVWSKVLPFVVLIWALTGAFYPAVDLCAGEKERGTLETLLSSPAARSEIVWGKLLTVMLFSITTSLLNMLSITITATLFVRQLDQAHPLAGGLLGAPPLAALGWLVLILVPISALFSALALAVASFARSSKEGQYYLMPLLLVMLPLMILPLLPGAELDLGTSLIPVTGAILLVRSLIEGQYAEALIAVPSVMIVTAAGCMLAIRWAIEQFNNENVLFRESERWDVRLLLRHFVRDREAVPTFGQAVLCGLILLVVRFFASVSSAGIGNTWDDFAASTVVGLAGFILAPPLLMTVLMTRSPSATLLLHRPRWSALPAVVLLALALHPATLELSRLIRQVYPVSAGVVQELQKLDGLFASAPSLWSIVGVLAFIPAICEELAFRGFILSGLRSRGSDWTAILISSAFFGAVHAILQQSLAAFVLGLVIGYVAVQTKSIWPCMLFHFTHNALQLIMALSLPSWLETTPWLSRAIQLGEDGHRFHSALVALGLGVAGLILFALHRQARGDARRRAAALATDEGELGTRRQLQS